MAIESWQVETLAAELYEKRLVPALMAAWTPRTIEAASVQPGDQVLDVACGTGVVSRAALRRAGNAGHVVGLDLNPGMLAVACTLGPEIEWRQGDATALPFADASFERVTCQFALMFFPDRLAALREMRRVLKPAGRLALATWGAIDASPPYARQAQIAERLAGCAAAAIVNAPFMLPDPAELDVLLAEAGFAEITVASLQDVVTYPDVDAFIEGEFDATPLGAFLLERNGATYDEMKSEMRAALAPYASDSGITFPIVANIASARPA